MTTKFISDMGPKSALIAPRPLGKIFLKIKKIKPISKKVHVFLDTL